MIKYKRVDTENGRTMYFKNGKLTKEADIPEAIRANLVSGVELSVGTPDPEVETQTVDDTTANEGKSSQSKECIFCGEPATRVRFVDLKIANLCDKDYESHTTGEIVAQMRP